MTTLVILACLAPVALVATARLAYRLGVRHEHQRSDCRAIQAFCRGVLARDIAPGDGWAAGEGEDRRPS